LGAVINWGIGRWGFAWMRARLSIASTERLVRVEHWYLRWGWMSLLASWVPVIGDPLTCVAGAMREPLWRFLMVVTVAKGGRYAVLIGAVSSLQALSL
ncbi:MAG: VTT domain-containing protein, partial [Litorivicinaceae bacterium]|nr:VTT domain-containing protein [Litorivicinaceae bacterium]